MKSEEITEKSEFEEELELVLEKIDSIPKKNHYARMREGLFAGYFLPRIFGVIEDKEDNWIAHWSELVGNLATRVDIYDDRTEEVLFELPPILRADILRPKADTGFGVSDVIKEYKMRAGNPLRQPETYIDRNLSQLHYELHTTILDDMDDIEKWKWVLGRYGYMETSSEKGEVSETKTEAVESLDDFLEY